MVRTSGFFIGVAANQQAVISLSQILPNSESANSEGFTSRFGWARRVSSGNVARRAAPTLALPVMA